jgi:hypothetical protein
LGYDARLTSDQWVHVAATADSEGGQALYVAGKQVASARREFPIDLASLDRRLAIFDQFHRRLVAAGLAAGYEAAHARLALDYAATTCRRLELLAEGKLSRLPAVSQHAADKSYISTTARLCEGLERTVESYRDSDDPHKARVHAIWAAVAR